MATKIEVDFNEETGEHWWRFVGGNGKTECASETFALPRRKSRAGAIRAAKRMAARIQAAAREQAEKLALLDKIEEFARQQRSWGEHGRRRFMGRAARPVTVNATRRARREAALATRTTPRRVAKAAKRGRPWALAALRDAA